MCLMFESSVNSYDGQTWLHNKFRYKQFESSVNSYDGQTRERFSESIRSLRVV